MAVSFNSLGELGRLGNQMFQYAFLLNLNNLENTTIKIPNVKKKKSSDYKLPKVFNLNNEIEYSESSFERLVFEKNVNTVTYDKRIKNIQFEEKDIYGYFQSYKYFDHIKEIVVKNFQFKSEIKKVVDKLLHDNHLNVDNYFFIHVRGSDYLKKSEFHFNLDQMYYKKSLKYFPSDMKCIIFTDDVGYAKKFKIFQQSRFQYFNDFKFEKSQSIKDAYELYLMTLCNGGIIANSSFSWWGAYLQNSIDNVIVAPNYKYWFGYRYSFNAEELIYPSWLQIRPGWASVLKNKFDWFFYKIKLLKVKIKKVI